MVIYLAGSDHQPHTGVLPDILRWSLKLCWQYDASELLEKRHLFIAKSNKQMNKLTLSQQFAFSIW